jgi:hypothetical protein
VRELWQRGLPSGDKTGWPMLDKHYTVAPGQVMDPWNELEHWRPAGLSETEYVSQTLSYVRNWARTHGVHVFIVAHPRNEKRVDGKLPIAKLDMISGSQHWWNKADGFEEIRLPNGKTLEEPISTTTLDKMGFSDYMTQIEAWAAEHGLLLWEEAMAA